MLRYWASVFFYAFIIPAFIFSQNFEGDWLVIKSKIPSFKAKTVISLTKQGEKYYLDTEEFQREGSTLKLQRTFRSIQEISQYYETNIPDAILEQAMEKIRLELSLALQADGNSMKMEINEPKIYYKPKSLKLSKIEAGSKSVVVLFKRKGMSVPKVGKQTIPNNIVDLRDRKGYIPIITDEEKAKIWGKIQKLDSLMHIQKTVPPLAPLSRDGIPKPNANTVILVPALPAIGQEIGNFNQKMFDPANVQKNSIINALAEDLSENIELKVGAGVERKILGVGFNRKGAWDFNKNEWITQKGFSFGMDNLEEGITQNQDREVDIKGKIKFGKIANISFGSHDIGGGISVPVGVCDLGLDVKRDLNSKEITTSLSVSKEIPLLPEEIIKAKVTFINVDAKIKDWTFFRTKEALLRNSCESLKENSLRKLIAGFTQDNIDCSGQ